jgi:hypothetical protein
MTAFRRRLASGALALTALQLALLFAGPVAACCDPAIAAHRAQRQADADAPDCCPPGSHPPGECPLHRGSKPEARGASASTRCRMTCDRSSGPQLVVGAIGVLPAPAGIAVPIAESAMPVPAAANVPLRPSIPDAPPPELL